MPKKIRRVVVKKKPAASHYYYNILVFSLVITSIISSVVVYLLVTEESEALPNQTLSAGALIGQLNIVDLSFLRTNKIKYGQDKKTNFVRSLSAGDKTIPLSVRNFKNAAEVGNQFVKDYVKFFGVRDSRKLAPQAPKKDELGMSHIAYQQKINNVPVFGGAMLVHVNSDLSVKSAAAKLLANTTVNTSPKISARSAGNTVKRIWKDKYSGNGPNVSAGKLYVFNKSLLDKRFEDKNYLVWELKAVDRNNGLSETYYIDARGGEVVFKTTNVKDISRRVYNCDSDRGICTSLLGTDANQRSSDRAEGWGGANAGEVDSVYQMVGQAHNYFENVHGTDGANTRDGIGDGTDGHPRASTDVYANWPIPRSWDINCPNAFFLDNKMMFCPNTVSLGVVGHEYSHAVSQFYGRGLVYAFESGAIEEGVADIMGQGVENFVNGSPSWRINLTPGNLLRNFANPSSLNLPGRYYSNNFYCGDNDSGGVHTNSNVVSHAAYLLSTGEDFNGCSLQSIGFDKTEKIFFRALDRYLLSNADFNDLYFALDNACADLYDDAVCSKVRRALQAVEIDQPGPCGGDTAAPRPTCAPPYLASVSANAGYYAVNDSINLQFKFSRPVRLTGEVGVLAHTGGSSATTTICTLDLSELSDTAECSFKVREGNNAVRFRIDGLEPSRKWTIVDEDSIAMDSLVPEDNLSKGAVVIDTESPYGSVNINNGDLETNFVNVTLTHNARDNNSGVEYYRVSNDGERFSRWLPYEHNSVWNLYNNQAGGGEEPSVADRYPRQVYVQFKDKAGNMSETYSDEITFSRMELRLQTPALFQAMPATSSGQESGSRAVDTRTNTVFYATTTSRTTSEISQSSSVATPDASFQLAPVQVMVREPDFTISAKSSKLNGYLSGVINYWGKGSSCEGPRSTDPVIIRWGDGATTTLAPSSKSFSSSHSYKKSGAYDVVVTLTNGCSGYAVKRLTVKVTS